MTYEIPKNLTKYSEEFLFGFSFKNFLYLIGVLLVVIIILFRFDHAVPEFWLRVVITIPFLIIGMLLIIFKVDEKLADLANFKRSTRNSSYFDGKTASFVEVDEIVDDAVILKDGTIIGILEIKPLDFFILSKEDKAAVLRIYQSWLRSLDYPVQILSRSLDVNLSRWLKNLELRNAAADKKHFEEFSSWISQEIKNNEARNRQFYILIPQRKDAVSKSLGEDLKGIFTGRFTGPVDKENQEYRKRLDLLSNQMDHCRRTLQPIGVKAKRLSTTELLGLYTAYFTSSGKINPRMLQPITWFSQKDLSIQEKEYARC